MAFVVEDGSGVADANSYTTVEFADGYFSDRGNTAWTGDPTAKQGWLIQATDYIEMVFGGRFIGQQKTDEQALSWPRTNAKNYADDEIPLVLQKACAEYALRAISGPLAPDPSVNESGLITVVTKSKVGPIEEDSAVVTKGSGSSVILLRPYPAADGLMRKLIYVNDRVVR